jgi:hypothetical protein
MFIIVFVKGWREQPFLFFIQIKYFSTHLGFLHMKLAELIAISSRMLCPMIVLHATKPGAILADNLAATAWSNRQFSIAWL